MPSVARSSWPGPILPIRTEVLVMWTKAPLSCLQYLIGRRTADEAAAEEVTEITVSQSSGVIR